MTVAWSGGGNFSNASGATTTIATIPAASYGINPTVAVAIGYHGGSGAASTNHTIDLLYAGSGTFVFTLAAARAEGPSGTDSALAVFHTIPTGDLDGGASVRVKTNNATASPPEVGAAVACVVTYATNNPRDEYETNPVVAGGMATGTINNSFDNTVFSFPALYNPESTVIAMFAVGAKSLGTTPSWASLAPYTDIITQTNGASLAQIATWTRPTPLNTNIQITNSPGGTGTYAAFITYTFEPAPVVATGRGFAQVIG